MNLYEAVKNVSEKSPLVHSITNYVTVNDCANILLAAKASPVMADDPREAADITKIAGGLNINIGTLNEMTIKSMFLSGEAANAAGIPAVLDAVGAGASPLRTSAAAELIEKVKFSAVKGNISEIKALMGVSAQTKGVDAAEGDSGSADDAAELAKSFSKKTGAITVITGKVDIITDGERVFKIYNGAPLMKSVTGTGCMLSALLGAFLAANKENMLEAAAAAVCMMGICGEKALARMKKEDGNSSYRNYIIDAVYNFSEIDMEAAKYEL